MIKIATNIIKGIFRHKTRDTKNDIGWFAEKWIKHQNDEAIKKVNLGSYTIFYKRPYELLHSYHDIFGHETYNFLSANDCPVIIDCGSNIGLSVLYFKKLYSKAKIFAFEPDVNNFQILKQNIEQNKLQNIEAFEAAVWIKDGEISFEAKESEASHISNEDSQFKVKCVRLRSVLDRLQEVEFLKIDIEGAEDEVLKDIKDSLYKVKNLFLEYHGKTNETEKLNLIFNILQENRFNVYIKSAADNLSYPFVEKHTNTIYDVQLNLFCFR